MSAMRCRGSSVRSSRRPRPSSSDGRWWRKFIAGYRRGAAAYHEAFGKRDNGKLVPGPNYDEMIGILSSALKQPPALVASGLPFIDPEGRLDVGDIYKQVAFWQSTGQVSRDADPKSFIDLSFVQGHFNVPK
jgi:NitT/TauT family transport system substrate-binding protein